MRIHYSLSKNGAVVACQATFNALLSNTCEHSFLQINKAAYQQSTIEEGGGGRVYTLQRQGGSKRPLRFQPRGLKTAFKELLLDLKQIPPEEQCSQAKAQDLFSWRVQQTNASLWVVRRFVKSNTITWVVHTSATWSKVNTFGSGLLCMIIALLVLSTSRHIPLSNSHSGVAGGRTLKNTLMLSPSLWGKTSQFFSCSFFFF